MNNTTRNELKARFDRAMNFLRVLGFKGEVCISAGVVAIHATDKASASMIRKAFKKVRAEGVLVEKRNKLTGGAIFIHADTPAEAQAQAAAA